MKIKYVHAVTSMLLKNRIQFYKDLSNNRNELGDC